ncbi:AtuA-related protein [Nocardioides sambongensis]|uniref:AtuA-related protein n=1 Tax=Nocardioides sambongensis TaxID=2589074 RepID=UPI0018C88DE9|nr:hypothetical protein [Nocardioides sambongensis]
MTVLDDLADVRAGDKGDTLILAVLPRDPDDHPRLVAGLTEERVAAHFGGALTGPVRVSEMPTLPALVLTLPGALGAASPGRRCSTVTARR